MLFIIACLILGYCGWKLITSSPLKTISFIIKSILLFAFCCGILLCLFAFQLHT